MTLHCEMLNDAVLSFNSDFIALRFSAMRNETITQPKHVATCVVAENSLFIHVFMCMSVSLIRLPCYSFTHSLVLSCCSVRLFVERFQS